MPGRRANALAKRGVEIVGVPSRQGRVDLPTVLAELGRREILSVLLEAGPTLNGAALAAGLVHKLFLFYAPKLSGENRVPFAFSSGHPLPHLHNLRTHAFGPDIALEAYVQH